MCTLARFMRMLILLSMNRPKGHCKDHYKVLAIFVTYNSTVDAEFLNCLVMSFLLLFIAFFTEKYT